MFYTILKKLFDETRFPDWRHIECYDSALLEIGVVERRMNVLLNVNGLISSACCMCACICLSVVLYKMLSYLS